jgi:hypothetical protein
MADANSAHMTKVSIDEMFGILNDPMAGAYEKTVVAGGKTVLMKNNKICAHCNAGYGRNKPFPPGGGLCGNCQNVHYCNRECQSADWGKHKPVCAAYAEARKQTESQ